MAQGLNLKIIHSAIDFMVGFFLTVHSQERTRNLQKKNTWFTMVYPHSPRKKTSCVPSRWWFHGYSSFVDKPTSWIILVDECHDPTLTQSNIPLWNTIGVSPFGPVRDEKKKNILIRIVSIYGCLNQLLHPMIFPLYPHCIRTFGWLNHVKAIFGDPDTPPRRSKARITSLISSALCFKQAAATRRGGSPVWIMGLPWMIIPDRIPGDL